MSIGRVMKWLALIVSCVLLLTAAMVVFAWRDITSHRINMSSPSGDAFIKNVQDVVAMARAGKIPSRRINHESIGHPIAESNLLELRRDITIFETIQHRNPSSIPEMLGGCFQRATQQRLENLAEMCKMIPVNQNSFILNCDGWGAPSPDRLNATVASFEAHTERFYEVENHILLYVPPLSLGSSSAGER